MTKLAEELLRYSSNVEKSPNREELALRAMLVVAFSRHAQDDSGLGVPGSTVDIARELPCLIMDNPPSGVIELMSICSQLFSPRFSTSHPPRGYPSSGTFSRPRCRLTSSLIRS